MKIRVADLLPNPFRSERYPMDQEKLGSLRGSMQQTGYWEGSFPVRKSPTEEGKFETPFGEHRKAILQELGIEEIEVCVMDISDENMLHMLADENMDSWSPSPTGMIETVRTVRDHLKAKGKKGTQETILEFLGLYWKSWMIADSLSVLNAEESGELDPKAVTGMTIRRAKAFQRATKRVRVPKEEQQKLAEEIQEEEVPTPEIEEAVREKTGAPAISEDAVEKEVKEWVSIAQQIRQRTALPKLPKDGLLRVREILEMCFVELKKLYAGLGYDLDELIDSDTEAD